MPVEQDLSVMILVKAAPVLTSHLQETMCVAAMTLDNEPAWIRLHPVPFRDLADVAKFQKYQEVTVRAIRPTTDRRPESWKPIEGSIHLGQTIGTEHCMVDPPPKGRNPRRAHDVRSDRTESLRLRA